MRMGESTGQTHERDARSFRMAEVPLFLVLRSRAIKVKFESTDDISPFSTFRHFPPSWTRPWIHLNVARRIIYVNLSSLNIPQELWSKPVSLRNQPEANVTCPSSFFPYFRLACYRHYFRVFMSVLTLTPVTSNRINATNVMLLLYTRLVIIGGSNDRAKVMTRPILSRVSRPVRETAMFISAVLQNHSRIVFVFTWFAIDKTQEQLRFFLAAYSSRLPILYLNNFQNINFKSILRLYTLNVRNT